VVDLPWSRWVLSGEVVGQCCPPLISLISLESLLGGCKHSVSVPSVGIFGKQSQTLKIVCQVSRDGAAERRPSGHSDGLSGGAGTTRPPATAHRHRTLQTKIIYQNIPLHHVREREAEPVFVKTFMETRNRDSASLCSLAGAGTKNRIVVTGPSRLGIDSRAL
jgi:hypothetical protein